MENFKKIGWSLAIPIVLCFFTVLLGYISFNTVFPEYPFLRKLYYAFQLFSMESGDRFYERDVAYSLMTQIIYNTARFLAILTLIYAIVLAFLSVIKERFNSSRVKRMHDHTILCGLGDLGNTIARNFEPKKKLVIIEKDIQNENLEQLRKKGVKIVGGNALDPEVLKRVGIEHAKCLYALTGDDFDNLTIIRNAKTILKDFPSGNSALTLAGNIDSLNLKKAAYQEINNKDDYQKSALRKLLDTLREKAVSIADTQRRNETNVRLLEEFEHLKTELRDYDPVVHPERIEPENKVKLFNINELAARYVFRQYPPDRFIPVTNETLMSSVSLKKMNINEGSMWPLKNKLYTHENDQPVHILLLGYSQMGEELFKLCVQNCHYINRKHTKITLLYQDADLAGNKILTKHKDITKLIDLQFVKLNPHHLTPGNLIEYGLTSVDVIYICSEQDRYQASYTRTAREVFETAVPIVRWFSKNIVTGASNKDTSNIYTIEILKSAATPQNIIDEAIDFKAIAIHNRWLKHAIGGYVDQVEKNIRENQEIPFPKATLLPWHLLDEEIRDDNRSVVEHNFIKLRTVGQLTDPEFFLNPENAIVDFGFLSNDPIVEQLAEMEHRRWMANKYFHAWEYNPVRNDSKKHHNDLLDFEDLDQNTQNYDISQVKELKEVW